MTRSQPDHTSRRAVLIGCGDLGSCVGTALALAGHDVTGVRRNVAALPEEITAVGVDLAVDDVPDLPADLLVVALAPDQRDEAGYRRTYVEAMRRGVEAVLRTGAPDRAVLVSSTSVYGDLQGDLDEETTPAPSTALAQILLDAEAHFRDALPAGTVLRLSGLYGSVRSGLVEQSRRGQNPDPGRWTNRVHRDDAAAAVVHLLTRPSAPDPLYIGTDDEPSLACDVRGFVANELGLERPSPRGVAQPHGRRMLNARLRASGFELRYPTFRDGYRELLRRER